MPTFYAERQAIARIREKYERDEYYGEGCDAVGELLDEIQRAYKKISTLEEHIAYVNSPNNNVVAQIHNQNIARATRGRGF